jgi:outer membrane protein
MRLQKILNVISIIAFLGFGILSYFVYQQSKIKYVDTIKLVQEFAMTKELEKKEEPTIKGFTARIDTISAFIKNTNNKDLKQNLLVEYDKMQNTFQSYYANSNKEINGKIWERLNKIIPEFGKQNDFCLLIGANGMGTILYGKENKDVTVELIEFANKKYKNEN